MNKCGMRYRFNVFSAIGCLVIRSGGRQKTKKIIEL